jgi:periplasmic divalent cation tolerance protein
MTHTPELVEIVTTVRTEAEAVALATALVRERLVACANLAACRSIYRWRGEIPDETEVQLALKTLASRAAAAEERLRELHPYETPAILRLPVAAASPSYAAWVAESVDAERAGGADPT